VAIFKLTQLSKIRLTGVVNYLLTLTKDREMSAGVGFVFEVE